MKSSRWILVLLIMSWSVIACSCESQKNSVSNDALTVTASETSDETTDEATNEGIVGSRFELTALQEDFATFRRYVENFHPMLYADREEVTQLLDATYEQITDGMTTLEFYRLVAPIVTTLRCGHTYLGLSESDYNQLIEQGKFLPFSIYWQDEHAWLRQNSLIPDIPIGAEIVSIEGIPMKDIIAGIYENFASDGTNETMKARAVNAGFRYHYAIDHPSQETVMVSYLLPETTQVKEMEVPMATKTAIEEAGDAFWDQDMNLARENSMLFEEDYAVLQMASFYPEGSDSVASYNAFIDDFFKKVDEKQLTNIIIDVRDDFGGDPNVASHLFSYLEKEPVPYFANDFAKGYPSLRNPIPMAEQPYTGNVYVLINGNCFSTTGHFLALMKYHQIGTMIGEESGGSFACTDASSSTTLEHTQLSFRYSTRIYQVAVEGLTEGRGIMPDYMTSPSLEEVMNLVDVDMRKAIELIRGE